MSDFYKTRMGQRFYERTVPDLVKQLERIADRLPGREPDATPEVDELMRATRGLINAVRDIPWIHQDRESNLYRRMIAAEKATEGIR